LKLFIEKIISTLGIFHYYKTTTSHFHPGTLCEILSGAYL